MPDAVIWHVMTSIYWKGLPRLAVVVAMLPMRVFSLLSAEMSLCSNLFQILHVPLSLPWTSKLASVLISTRLQSCFLTCRSPHISGNTLDLSIGLEDGSSSFC